MLTFVTFKWHTPGYRAEFTAEHVNTMRRMVARHYEVPHRFLCITDDPSGLDAGIEHAPLWDDYASVPNPTGGGRPSCYRRLKLFAPGMESLLGERFVMLDLDAIVVRDLRPLFDRDEDLVLYRSPHNGYNGGMFMHRTGSMPFLWEEFDPVETPKRTTAAGFRGSDQAWYSTRLGLDMPQWDERDGVYWYARLPNRAALPKNARIVFTTSCNPPWKHGHAWTREHYR